MSSVEFGGLPKIVRPWYQESANDQDCLEIVSVLHAELASFILWLLRSGSFGPHHGAG